jgi:hypothetical protein
VRSELEKKTRKKKKKKNKGSAPKNQKLDEKNAHPMDRTANRCANECTPT